MIHDPPPRILYTERTSNKIIAIQLGLGRWRSPRLRNYPPSPSRPISPAGVGGSGDPTSRNGPLLCTGWAQLKIPNQHPPTRRQPAANPPPVARRFCPGDRCNWSTGAWKRTGALEGTGTRQQPDPLPPPAANSPTLEPSIMRGYSLLILPHPIPINTSWSWCGLFNYRGLRNGRPHTSPTHSTT